LLFRVLSNTNRTQKLTDGISVIVIGSSDYANGRDSNVARVVV